MHVLGLGRRRGKNEVSLTLRLCNRFCWCGLLLYAVSVGCCLVFLVTLHLISWTRFVLNSSEKITDGNLTKIHISYLHVKLVVTFSV